MLKKLLIKNYALIQHLEINPSHKLNIVTGETGAGKSIMLGAINLLMGNRADTKVLFDQSQKCVIEGEFGLEGYGLQPLFEQYELDYEKESSIRREISPTGRSRAFVNDTPVNLETLREITAKLMDVHSQHDNLLLGSNDFQLNIVDSFAGSATLLADYQETWQVFRQAAKDYNQLLRESQEMQAAFDFNQHQLRELQELPLDELDQQALEEELEVLENAESIKAALNEALELISRTEFAAETSLKGASQAMASIKNFAAKYNELLERLRGAQIELADIGFEIEKQESALVFDQERSLQVKELLDQLYSLQKKHRCDSVEALIRLREGLLEKVEKVLNYDDELKHAAAKVAQARAVMLEKGEALSACRRGVLDTLATEMDALLTQLGMPNARVHVSRQAIEAEKSGLDFIELRFSANKGIAPEPLRNVASGGEFSRLMLAIKYILAGKTQLPTIIFDEIDTGISGEIAIKMGKMMREMSERHQVMAISHLPQIAARGEAHYFVYKDNSADRTVSRIRKLEPEERIEEIAQMIGGANPSPVAYQSARELMAQP